MDIPNLKGVIRKSDVEQIGTGSYKADYINWARTMNLLHEHAPGWLPYTMPAPDGGMVHRAPIGGIIWLGFELACGVDTDDIVRRTPAVPQAIMDNRNNAIPWEKITARHITDTHRRGLCMAAALTFGLAYELWADEPVETGYSAHGVYTGEKPAATGPESDKSKVNRLYKDYLDLVGDDRAKAFWADLKGLGWEEKAERINEAIVAEKASK